MPRTAARFTQADARRIIAAGAQARVPVAVEPERDPIMELFGEEWP